MDGLFAVAIVWSSLAIGLFALASTAWYQGFGDRRLAAAVSAALLVPMVFASFVFERSSMALERVRKKPANRWSIDVKCQGLNRITSGGRLVGLDIS